MFSVTNVYCDAKGNSSFEDIVIPLNDAGEIGQTSEILPQKGVILREVEANNNYQFHVAAHNQCQFLLDEIIEIETSLGETRQFSAGEELLLEDTVGKGHRSRNTKLNKTRSVFIPIP